jgi:hypothetical protein
MSRLSAYTRTPARPRFRVVRPEGDAVILQFPNRATRFAATSRHEERDADSVVAIAERLAEGPQALLKRARALHHNRCCPNCHRGGTIPLDLGDGDVSHSAMPVPGTSTLVGFYCDSCGAEWPLEC